VSDETTAAGSEPQRPALRIVHGSPSSEEVAALVTVLAARGGAAAADAEPRSTWNDRGRAVRPSLIPGPGAWKASALPH
jgi:hypothetical protein